MPSRDNLTSQPVTAGAIAASAAQVSFPTRYNIISVSLPVGSGAYFVRLPADADTAIGDLAEFYVVNRSFASIDSSSLTITDDAGNDFYSLGGQDLSAVYPKWSISIRKIASNTWRVI